MASEPQITGDGRDPNDGAEVSAKDAEFYRRSFHFAPTPLFVSDNEGRVVLINEAMEALTGWSADEAIGENMLDYLHPDDVGWVAETFIQLADAPDSHEFDNTQTLGVGAVPHHAQRWHACAGRGHGECRPGRPGGRRHDL